MTTQRQIDQFNYHKKTGNNLPVKQTRSKKSQGKKKETYKVVFLLTNKVEQVGLYPLCKAWLQNKLKGVPTKQHHLYVVKPINE
jgi:hypothetical protein